MRARPLHLPLARAAALLCLAAAAPAQEPARAFVELATDAPEPWLHEPFAVRVRVGLERALLEDGLVPLFSRPLDVPVQLHVPWWDGLPERAAALAGAPAGADARAATLALDERPVAARRLADEERGGRTYALLELERRLLPERAGELELAPATLRLAWATRFQEGLLGTRTPLDRREEHLASAPLVLRVRALPDEGRPADFSGAVGRFHVRAEARPTALAAGESLALTLTVEGPGAARLADAPRLERLPGFHVRGVVAGEPDGADARRFVYDLAPESAAVRALPPVSFSYFDPTPPAGYVTVRTERIPLEVRPAPAQDAPATDAGARDAAPVDAPEDAPAWAPLVLPLGLVAALGLAAWLALRARRPRAPAEAAALRVAAARALPPAPDADEAERLAGVLGAALGRPPSAVIAARDLAERLAAAGLPAELAERAARRLEELVAVRYGGLPPAEGAEDVEALSRRVEAALRAPGR